MKREIAKKRVVVLAVGLAAVGTLCVAPGATAAQIVCTPGAAAGSCGPRGIAVDEETGRLFVADATNNRIDVFGPTGAFERAFGWGVKNGVPELQVCTSICGAGIAGSGAGQFDEPTAIAVDNSSGSGAKHDVYVVDLANRRVEKFSPEGEFLLSFGGPGEGEGQFSTPSNFSRGIYVGVGPVGSVYVVDSPGGTTGVKYRIQRFDPAGNQIELGKILFESSASGIALALAVDPGGDFYVSNEGAVLGEAGERATIRKYKADGTPLGVVAEERDEAMAVSGAGHLFAAGNTELSLPGPNRQNSKRREIAEFDSTGTMIRKVGYGEFTGFDFRGVAPFHSATGDIYASESGQIVKQVGFSPPGPVILPDECRATTIGNNSATLTAEINPEGMPTTFHYEIVTQEEYDQNIAEFGSSHGFDNALRVPSSEGADPALAGGFSLQLATLKAELTPETKYRCRVRAKNAEGEAIGQEGNFETKEPFEFGRLFVAGVTPSSAVLQAEGNPLGIPTTAQFEYVDDASFQIGGFANASIAPATPLDFGEGNTTVLKSTVVSGLSPATTYHFRLRVKDQYFEEGITCPRAASSCPSHEPTFRTFDATSGPADERAWELVSPSEKNSAEVAVPGGAGGLFFTERIARIEASAESGEAVTYTSWTSFGEVGGAPGTSQYLSRRTSSGWTTENISPSGRQRNPVDPSYRGFSAELAFGGFTAREPQLTPDAQPGIEDLYLQDNEAKAISALTTEEPQVTPPSANFCTAYAGASIDGKHAYFAANGALAGAPAGEGETLYEWSKEEPLRLISVLPGGSPAPPSPGTKFGAEEGQCVMGQGIVRHAVSSNGSIVFWKYGGKYGESNEPLLARINGTETIQLDAKTPGEKSGGEGRFWAATADGSMVFFTAPGRLTSVAHAAGQLYRYVTKTRKVVDLTPGSVAPEIKGVIGASEDGTTAYFVASGALTGGQENAVGEKAEAGANNLYSWQEGEGLRFIAILSNLDQGDWDPSPSRLTARLAVDGSRLTFLSVETEALSGYDDRIFPGSGCQPFGLGQLNGDPRCAEVYLYTAASHELTCVSCNPSRARPSGPAGLPVWTNPFEGPRYLSQDGSRLFFESRDMLTASDTSAKRDVYEFELVGAGTCSTGSPSYVEASGGCISLISSGNSEDESYFLDASADGRDVFFSTRKALVGWDRNADYDVYDAREGGGFPKPPPPSPVCEAEGCRPAAAPPPVPIESGTSGFQGTGNPKPRKQKRHKHRKHKHRGHHRKGKR